ncbi:MAG: spore coat protein CotH [Ruminococcaceae bacterium]|nr:spore coat protein CotH [Oscillospiraceae bacterium]
MKKGMKFVALIVSFVFILSGCIKEKPVEEISDNTIKQYVDPSLDGYKFRDNKYLYKNSDPKKVVTMYLTVLEGNSGEGTDHTWEEVNSYSVYDYEKMGIDRYKVEGLLQVGDESGPLPGELGYNQISPNCTVQIRGQSSSLREQKNYKISVKDNKGQWNGQSTIALNKHVSDPTRFRNKLSYDLISGIDEIMGLRTTFVHLYVKDTTSGGNNKFTDYGLYTQVEQLNKTALKAHGLDNKGHLYKINFCEFYRYEDVIKLKDDPDFNIKEFEKILEVKGNDDHSKLIKMLEDVNDYSKDFDEVLDKHFDIENLSYWMAYQILMGNIDTQSRNFYIYSPLNIDKWYIIPWDNDGSLRRTELNLAGRSDNGGWEEGISNYWGNVLFKRALKSEKYVLALNRAIEEIKAYLNYERVNEYVTTYASIVKPYLYRMPDIMYAPVTSGQFDYIVKNLANEIEANYLSYKESYEKPMPFFIGLPKKTEKGLYIECEGAFDFDLENITYNIQIAKDYRFSNVVANFENVLIPAVTIDMLPKGQYFIKVTATNASGYTQTAFDYYMASEGKQYGVKCFYVEADGTIVEDIYVEG